MWPFTQTDKTAIPLNIGGIYYKMDGSPAVNYMYRGSEDFRKTFEPIAKRIGSTLPEIQSLFEKYMNALPHMTANYREIPEKDKKRLIKILEAYLIDLEYSIKIMDKYIVGTHFTETQRNIENIIAELKSPPTTTAATTATANVKKESCEVAKSKLQEITPETRTLMILELLWLLSHPDKITTTDECTWAEKVSELSTMRLQDVTKKLTQDVKNGTGDGNNIKMRVEQLLQVYGINQMMEKSEEVEPAKPTNEEIEENDPVVNDENDEVDYEEFGATEGGGRTSTKFDIALGYAMIPLFNFIKSKYDPIYGLLESCYKKSRVKKHKILPRLLTLLHISNYFLSSQHQDKSLSYGIYRIRSVHKDLVQFITSHLTCSSYRIEKMSSTKQKKFLEILHTIFPIRISSLPKQKSVSPLVVDKEIPTVRFMTLDGNLTSPPFELFYKKGTESEKEACYQSMTNFFTKNDIYMIYSLSEEIPMNLYEINFSEIDTTDKTISIKTPITYFSTPRNTHIQDFASVSEHAIYTNAELALSIFISLKVSTK